MVTFCVILTVLVFQLFGRYSIDKAFGFRSDGVGCRCSIRRVFFIVLQTISPVLEFQLEACNFLKSKTPAQSFSSEFCKISKSTYFEKHLRTGEDCSGHTVCITVHRVCMLISRFSRGIFNSIRKIR